MFIYYLLYVYLLPIVILLPIVYLLPYVPMFMYTMFIYYTMYLPKANVRTPIASLGETETKIIFESKSDYVMCFFNGNRTFFGLIA